MKNQELDAWEQLHNLQNRFTRKWKIRSDITVEALALDRAVRVSLSDEVTKPTWVGGGAMGASNPKVVHWQSTGPRNVSTMRELAAAIQEACDFVDESNPDWASHHPIKGFK